MNHRHLFGVISALALAAPPLMAQQDLGRDGTSWKWDGALPSGGWARIYSVNGQLHITASPDGNVHVRAEKRARSGGDPRSVHYAVVRDGNNLAVCALWSDDATCDMSGSHGNNIQNNWGNRRQNVEVDMEVQVPNGVKTGGNTVNGALSIEKVTSDVIAHTVNGEVRVEKVSASVKANTVNGDVTVNTTGGPVSAETVNGSIRASMGSQGSADMRFKSVNGTIDITTPAQLNADVEINTVNGSIDSKFPLNYDRRHRHADGVVGSGGSRLYASTVNGSVGLH